MNSAEWASGSDTSSTKKKYIYNKIKVVYAIGGKKHYPVGTFGGLKGDTNWLRPCSDLYPAKYRKEVS